ncbi:MAG TPA: type VI immunity family protein [Ideonella sp.]|uniref:type VI immunity family protein n=1 Tax=Ideonella sp. TaxID=1929293 RepID=UPI002C3E5147|nr:type VI immunity family protein [Ideonella sp.]HSI49047.1 type VI immunity family protein [Ideonella sp.]
MQATSEGLGPQLTFTIRDTPVVMPCFGIALYTGEMLSKHGDAVLKAFERFGQWVPASELRWYITETMNKRKQVTAKTLNLLPTWLRPGAPRREYIALDLNGGKEWWESSDINFSVFGQEEDAPALSLGDANWVRMSFPLGWMLDRLPELEAQALELFASMPFVSGSAGPMFELCPSYRMESQRFAWPTVMRYRGFDICDPEADCGGVRSDGLRSVGWLTFLGTRLADEFGGAAGLRLRLAKTVEIQELATGLCLKAGSRPALGDWGTGERLTDYESVFRACEPAIERMAQRYSPMDLGQDEKEKTRRLMRRYAYEDA